MKKLVILPYKRKRNGRTDYHKRLALLKSGKERLVVRKALNNILLQVIQYNPDGDRIIITIHSNSLKKYGWDYHKGNLAAAYLTGLLCGKLSKEKGVNEAILDLGLSKSLKNSVQYAAVMGAREGGLKIPCSEEVLPNESKLCSSENLKKKFEEIKAMISGGKHNGRK